MVPNRSFAAIVLLVLAQSLPIAAALDEPPKREHKPAKQDGPKPKADPEHPTAETIPEADIEGTGGKKAYEKLRTRQSRGTVNIAGVNCRIETWAAAPNKLCSVTDMGDVGKLERGSDGKLAWEVSPLTGARILEGSEKAYFLRDATYNADLNWRKVCQSVDTVGWDFVEGEPAWEIKAVTRDGAAMMLYYNKYTSLLVRLDTKVKLELGEVAVEVYPSDYKKVGGILVPHKSTQKMLGMTQVATFDSITFNKPIPKER